MISFMCIRRPELVEPGSTICNRLLLTAKPTLCSLGSPSSLPRQKNVYSFSLRLPQAARRVSYRAAMSALSLSSSLLMTAVLRSPSLSRISSVRPVNIVRTFQLPKMRAGLLLVDP